MNEKGFTLVEILIVIGLLAFLTASGAVVMNTSQTAWSTTDVNIQLQENLRNTLVRMSKELSESGEDKDGNHMVEVQNNLGIGGSDIVRFSIPVCVCGNVMDANGDVRYWGAPLRWGQTGCSRTGYTVAANGKVDICHLPPGNPTNVQSISIDESSLTAHFAHGDILGDCGTCSVDDNRYIEYRIDADGYMIRRILDDGFAAVKEDIFASNITDFQAVKSADGNIITLTVDLERDTPKKRTITLTDTLDVYFRNKR